MNYRYLDMETYKRIDHFLYFDSLAYPYVGVTVNVDITELIEKIKTQKLPFFLSVCYCVTKAANSVPEFRQRIKEHRIIEFDRCKTSHTVALENGTFCYCKLDGNDMLFPDYIAYALREQEEAKRLGSIAEEEEEVYEKFFISSVPWISYTALIQPVPNPADSNPRISWGKYFVQGDRVLLPVSVLCNHALVDGIHIAGFYEKLDEQIRLLSDGQNEKFLL